MAFFQPHPNGKRAGDFEVIPEPDGRRLVRHYPSGYAVYISPDQKLQDAVALLLDAAEMAA